MVIRLFENRENGKGAIIHKGYKFYLIECYQLGDFKGTRKYKTLNTAQRKALKYINK